MVEKLLLDALNVEAKDACALFSIYMSETNKGDVATAQFPKLHPIGRHWKSMSVMPRNDDSTAHVQFAFITNPFAWYNGHLEMGVAFSRCYAAQQSVALITAIMKAEHVDQTQ